MARAVEHSLKEDGPGDHLYELAGPATMTYAEMSELVGLLAGRPRPVIRIPLQLVHLGLTAIHRLVGENAFATWQEAELMRVSMVTDRGTADLESLGVEPRPMAEVLGEY